MTRDYGTVSVSFRHDQSYPERKIRRRNDVHCTHIENRNKIILYQQRVSKAHCKNGDIDCMNGFQANLLPFGPFSVEKWLMENVTPLLLCISDTRLDLCVSITVAAEVVVKKTGKLKGTHYHYNYTQHGRCVAPANYAYSNNSHHSSVEFVKRISLIGRFYFFATANSILYRGFPFRRGKSK